MPVDKNIPWDLVSEVRRSKRKTEIVNHLNEDPSCASDLADVMEIQRGTISNHIRELKSTDPPIVECLTPKQPHHRLYALTEVGEIIQERV